MDCMAHVFTHRHSPARGAAGASADRRCGINRRRGRRVLVIEDHFALRQHLVVLLQALDPDCQVVDSGTLSDASRLVQTTPIDALLIDVHLPDGNGLEFAADFHARNPGTPIVVMSATDATELRHRVATMTGATYISKFESGDRWRTLLVDVLNRPLPSSKQ